MNTTQTVYISEFAHKMKNGVYATITADHNGLCNITIPSNGILGITPDELIQDLFILSIQKDIAIEIARAKWLLNDRDSRRAFRTDNLLKRFQKYQSHDANIDKLIPILEQEIEQDKREIEAYFNQQDNSFKKSVKQGLMKKRRSQFSRNREAIKLSLIERDGYGCNNCESLDNIEIDHIVPLSKGGTDDLDNLQFLCKRCNIKKGDKL